MLAVFGLEKSYEQSHGCIYLYSTISPIEGGLRLMSTLGKIQFKADILAETTSYLNRVIHCTSIVACMCSCIPNVNKWRIATRRTEQLQRVA